VTTTVAALASGSRRAWELVLIVFAVGVTAAAYASVGLAYVGTVPVGLPVHMALMAGLGLGLHVVTRIRAPYADPVIVPVALLLNGLGVVMIYRLDLAEERTLVEGLASRQVLGAAVGVAAAAAVLVLVRDHRLLRKRTFTALAVGFGLLALPLVPGLGVTINGARIWIDLGITTFQPAELAKVILTIFFAGYLVTNRDTLSLVGPRVLGLRLPRARDLGPILLAWMASVGILVFERDLGTSLLFFGIFVALLYVATERLSWIVLGLLLFFGGAVVAWRLFSHVQLRVSTWLDPFDPDTVSGASFQLAQGLYGMAQGGLLGTGLGRGRPDLVPFAENDFIVAAIGEELGLAGLFAVVVLYLVLVQRGLRTAVGVRDGFGKLLAAGLAFSLALQCFIVAGGVTRVIPLTGLTMPFLAYGGSALVSNWIIVGMLLRISDLARRPDPPATTGPDPAPTEVVSVR
jgi:cell division protein FtsW (lipid II flippase)